MREAELSGALLEEKANILANTWAISRFGGSAGGPGRILTAREHLLDLAGSEPVILLYLSFLAQPIYHNSNVDTLNDFYYHCPVVLCLVFGLVPFQRHQRRRSAYDLESSPKSISRRRMAQIRVIATILQAVEHNL